MNRKLLVSLLAVSATLASAQTKKALMIEPFDYSTVMTAVQAIFGTQQNIGTGIAAMLTTRVTQDGKFTVVERRKVANLTKEQDFDASNRVKRGTGARVGQIRGADLTLMGDIVVFGRDDRKVGGGAGAIVGGAGGFIGGSKSDAKAVVVLDYRLVDAETSEIVGSGEARGESKRSSKGFGAAMFVGGVGAGGGFNMTSSNFAETIIGEATMDAVNKLSQQIAAGPTTGSASSRENDLDALVADVNGASLTINAGSGAGLAAGQTFTVYHKGKEIKDPQTGEVLDVQTTPIGTLTITVVRDRISTGTFAASGGAAPSSETSSESKARGSPMRITFALLICAGLGVQAQIVPRVGVPGVGFGAGSLWRGNLGGILGQQPSKVTYDDLGRFDQYLVGAGAYCAALTAADYAANRYMVQSMASYVATMNAYTRDPRMRASLGQLRGRISAFPCAWAGYQPGQLVFDPVPPPVNTEPPFSMKPPDVPNVAAADQETFSDLQSRYRTDATRAASAWKSAAEMNARLATQGATLNADTAAAVSRFQLLFGLAAGSMLDHRWDEVLEHLQAVEAETTKVAKVVGR